MDFKILYQDTFYQRMSFSELLESAKEKEIHKLPEGLEKREIIRPLHRTFLDSVINHFKGEKLTKPSLKDFTEVVPLAADHYHRNYPHLWASTTLTEMLKDLGEDPGENWQRIDPALEAYAKKIYQIYYYDITGVVERQINKASFQDNLIHFGETVFSDTGGQVNAYWAILYVAMLCQCREKITVRGSIEYDFVHSKDGEDISFLMVSLDNALRKSGDYHVYVSFIFAYELFSRYFYMDQITSVFSAIDKYIKTKLA